MGNVPRHIKTLYWLHSAGADKADTTGGSPAGKPSFGSYLAIDALWGLAAQNEEGSSAIVFSGEATRKSHALPQGTVLANFWHENVPAGFRDTRVSTYDLSMVEAFQFLIHEYPDVEVIHFINADAYISFYEVRLLFENLKYASKLRFVVVPAAVSTAYRAEYPLDRIAAMNFAMWTQLGLKRIGIWQLFLFSIDRKLNKPTKNPLKRAIIKVVDRWIRQDLKG